MENKTPGPSKGYQKQVKIAPKSQPTPAKKPAAVYSSPIAKQLPLFLEALESGNVDKVKKFIEEGINVNISRNGITPLMIVASKGLVEIAEVIIQAGANVNEQSDEGWTALHKAASDQKESAIVDLLMQSGINVDMQDKTGKTALQLAEEKGHRDIALRIKKHQAAQEADALAWEQFLATADGKPYQQKRLHERLTLYGKSLWLPPIALGAAGFIVGYAMGARALASFIGLASGLLADGVWYGLERKVRTYLADYEPLPHLNIHILREKRTTGESITLKKNRRSIVENKKSEDLSVEHAPAISMESSLPEPVDDSAAIKEGVLHETPAPTNAEDSRKAAYAPAAAIKDNMIEDLSVEQAPAIGMESSLPEPSDNASIKESSRQKAPVVKKRETSRNVPYSIAAAILVLLICGVLVKSSAFVKWYYEKSVERRGVSFSDQAFLNEVSKNNEEVVDLFLKAGINADTVNDRGQTALMIASEKGYVDLLNKLVQLNKDSLNRVDKNGQTALMAAARHGREHCVASLVENGAEVDFLVPSGEGAASALQAAVDAADFNEEYKGVI